MSDDALHELVSRLVDAGGDMERDDANKLGDGQVCLESSVRNTLVVYGQLQILHIMLHVRQ